MAYPDPEKVKLRMLGALFGSAGLCSQTDSINDYKEGQILVFIPDDVLSVFQRLSARACWWGYTAFVRDDGYVLRVQRVNCPPEGQRLERITSCQGGVLFHAAKNGVAEWPEDDLVLHN